MPRRGWQAIEVPSGWYEVIRGPRPPSQKWPRASPHQSAQSRGQRRGLGRVGQSGQPNRARSPPEVALSAARQRVAKLEAALAALGDTGPEVTVLQSALKRAKQAAQEPPLDVQMSLCEQFVTRAQRRLLAHDEERTRLVSRVGRRPKSSCKIARGSNRQGGSCATVRHQPECGGHIVHLEEMVRTLQDELKATRSASCGFCLSQTVWGTCLR